MSLTNLCSCALIKYHKMRQIINDLYLLFLRIMNLAFLRKIFWYIFLRIWDCTPSSPPPPLWRLTCKTPIPKLLFLISSQLVIGSSHHGIISSLHVIISTFELANSAISQSLHSPSAFHLIVSPCCTYVSTVMRSAFADILVPLLPLGLM